MAGQRGSCQVEWAEGQARAGWEARSSGCGRWGDTVKVQMTLDMKVWDPSAERWKVGKGGVWPMEASCVLVGGEERWVLGGLLAELSGQAYMWQWEQGVGGDDTWRQEWVVVLRLGAWGRRGTAEHCGLGGRAMGAEGGGGRLCRGGRATAAGRRPQ